MHRDNWDAVFENQDRILKQLKPLENEMFLAGGTGLQRFVLPQAYRHSEDLDFFFTSLKTKEGIDSIKNKILELMSEIPNAKLENIKWIKDEKAYRIFYSFKDNDEIIKIELLNFTCCRLKDTSFTNSDIFRTENLYNLLLYKLKALCDRPDTIKDLFDLYFILRDLKQINIKTLIEDINKKFENAIGIKYSIENIIYSLNHNLDWDIEIGEHINHLHDLKLEIDLFQKALKNTFAQKDILDFSYNSKIQKKALELGLDKNDYIDVIEDNQFLVEEWNKYFRV
ncbi:nucleotidyl transferase AbiEii/AbiGii toxin family protein [Aliarcobacter lanthieri]|uniref:nucleotidyl transferase AbiEii/AbiGii toxin family protein n=1 Tax=Aliarcobacter lanthieri TaxID=1355374 RepID=UPI003AFA6B83